MKYPRIKPSLSPTQTIHHTIIVGTTQPHLGAEIQDDTENHIWQIMCLMDGERTIDQIVEKTQETFPSLTKRSIQNVIQTLIDKGFVEDMHEPIPHNLTKEDIERYEKSINYFSLIDRSKDSAYKFQSKLKDSHVTILGVGGVGSAVASSLAASGIGHLRLVDYDNTELSNLNRQTLYNKGDIGKSKVLQAAKHLQALNTTITVEAQTKQIKQQEDLLPLLQNTDLFILCADEPYFSIMRWTNTAALQTNTTWVYCAYTGPMIGVVMFQPHKTPCFQCMEHLVAENGRFQFIQPIALQQPPIHAAIAPIPQITGQLAALEAIYFLAGLTPRTLGVQFRQSLLYYNQIYYNSLAFWDACPSCGKQKNHGAH